MNTNAYYFIILVYFITQLSGILDSVTALSFQTFLYNQKLYVVVVFHGS